MSATFAQQYGDSNPYIYWYHDNHVPSFGSNSHCDQPNGGVCHTDEIPFVWGSTIAWNFTNDEMILSEMMRWYWASFAKGFGDVNKYSKESDNELYVEWINYDVKNNNRATMLFNTGKLTVEAPFENDEKYCDFWDQIGYDWINRQ